MIASRNELLCPCACAALSSIRLVASSAITSTQAPASSQYTLNHAGSPGLAGSTNALKTQLPASTPTMNRPSMVLVSRECAVRSAVSRPIEEYTPTLASANEKPTQANGSRVVRKLG